MLFKKAATLIETLTVILFISILSLFLFTAGYGVYKIFVRMTANEYENEYYYKTDPDRIQKRESDGIMHLKGWR